MLSSRDAFKVGFLHRCVEAGLGPDQIERVVKQAEDKMAAAPGWWSPVISGGSRLLGGATRLGQAGLGAASNLASEWALPAALIAPPALGALAGWGLARGSDIDDIDIDEIKDNELLGEYRRQLTDLERKELVRRYREQRGRTGRVFS